MSHATLVRKDSDAPALRGKADQSSVSGGLRIGAPDDAFEQEADRVANEVMSGGAAKRHWSLANLGGGTSLQRKCSCGASGGSGGECDQCKQEKGEQTLQRKASGATSPGVAPPIVHEVLNSPGQPLDKASRDFFEPRFGQDFSRVRLHADAQAAASAQAVNAIGYTVSQHIVLGTGSRSTASPRTNKLLAHELAHTLQQPQSGARGGSDRGGCSNRPHITPAAKPVVARQTPPSPGLRSTGLTPDEIDQLKATREGSGKGEFNLPAGKSTLVGILIDEETGKRYPVHSGEFGGPSGGTQRGGIPRGPGEGFSGGAPTEKNIVTHIEGHAAAIMREQKIKRATLLSPEPPCRVCSSPAKTPAVSVALPPGTRLTVVYPGAAETYWSSSLPTPGAPPGPGGSPPGGQGKAESKTPAKAAGAAQEAEGTGTTTKAAGQVEENVEGRPTRRIGGGAGAAEPSFARALGFAALSFAAGVGTSLLQAGIRDKILSDLARLPQPRPDKRGASEFLRDPATAPAVRLLDLLSKDIKPFTNDFQPQHDKIMTAAQLHLSGIALLPGKTTADFEKRIAQLDALSDEMGAYDEDISTVQANLAAMLSLRPKAMQCKAACDDLIAKLPTIFGVQGAASSALGFVPTPDPEDFAAIDSNLRFISVSIGMAFSDAAAAKAVIDKAAEQVASFRGALSGIWWNEFAAQFKELQKEQPEAKPPTPPKPPRPPAQAHATPPGVQLPSAPQGFPSIEEQRGKVPCPSCHDQPKQKEEFHIPEEFKKSTMTEEQMREWLKQGQQ